MDATHPGIQPANVFLPKTFYDNPPASRRYRGVLEKVTFALIRLS
jgi:hypothetical protein